MIYFTNLNKSKYPIVLYSLSIYTLIKSYYAGVTEPLNNISKYYKGIIRDIEGNPDNFYNLLVEKLQNSRAITDNALELYLLENLETTYHNKVFDYNLYGFIELLKNSSMFKDAIYLDLQGRGLYGEKLFKLTERYHTSEIQNVNVQELEKYLRTKSYNLLERLILLSKNWCNGAELKSFEELHSSVTDVSDSGSYDMSSISAEEFSNSGDKHTPQYQSANFYVSAFNEISNADRVLFTTKAQGITAVSHNHSSIMNYLGDKEWSRFSTEWLVRNNARFKSEDKEILRLFWDTQYTHPELKTVGGSQYGKKSLVDEGQVIIRDLLAIINKLSGNYDLKTEYPIFAAAVYSQFYKKKMGSDPTIYPSNIEKSASNEIVKHPLQFRAVFNGVIAAQCVRDVLIKNGRSLLSFPCIALRKNCWNKKSNLKELVEFTEVDQTLLSAISSNPNANLTNISITRAPINIVDICRKPGEKFQSKELLSDEIINTRLGGFNKLYMLTGSKKQDSDNTFTTKNRKEINTLIQSALINLDDSQSSPPVERTIYSDEREYNIPDLFEFILSLLGSTQYNKFKLCDDVFIWLTRFLLSICKTNSRVFNVTSIEFKKSYDVDKAEELFETELYSKVVSTPETDVKSEILYLLNIMRNFISDSETFLNNAAEIYEKILNTWCEILSEYSDLVVCNAFQSSSENALRIFVNIHFMLCLNALKKRFTNLLEDISDKFVNNPNSETRSEVNGGLFYLLCVMDRENPILSRPFIRDINRKDIKQFYLENFCANIQSICKMDRENTDMSSIYLFASILKNQHNCIWDLLQQFYLHLQNQIRMFLDFIVNTDFKGIVSLLYESDASNEEAELFVEAAKAFESFYVNNDIILNIGTINLIQSKFAKKNIKGNVLVYSNGNLFVSEFSGARFLYSIYGLQYNIDNKIVEQWNPVEVLKVYERLTDEDKEREAKGLTI